MVLGVAVGLWLGGGGCSARCGDIFSNLGFGRRKRHLFVFGDAISLGDLGLGIGDWRGWSDVGVQEQSTPAICNEEAELRCI